MRTLASLLILLLLVVTAGCDSDDSEGPDAESLTGTYALVRYGGSTLPSGGVTSGELRLMISETIPVYEARWTQNGGTELRSGLYTVSGNTIEFTETSGSALLTYTGVVNSNRITVDLNDGTSITFVFERT